MSKHLSVVERANLVVTFWRGREKLHYLTLIPLVELYDRRIGEYEPHQVRAMHEPLEEGSDVDAGLRRGWPAISSSLESFPETGSGLEVTKRWGEAGL